MLISKIQLLVAPRVCLIGSKAAKARPVFSKQFFPLGSLTTIVKGQVFNKEPERVCVIVAEMLSPTGNTSVSSTKLQVAPPLQLMFLNLGSATAFEIEYARLPHFVRSPCSEVLIE